jgi:hypothetical protein
LHILSIYIDGSIEKWLLKDPDRKILEDTFTTGGIRQILEEIRNEYGYDEDILLECFLFFQGLGLATAIKGGGFSSFKLSVLGEKFISFITKE